MSSSLRVLILEDSEADADLIQAQLQQAELGAHVNRVDSRDAFTAALREFLPDVVLSDHSLADFDAVAAMEVLRALRPGAPLIVVSGALDVRMLVACMRAGAEDIVLKANLAHLPGAIDQALRIRRPLEKLSPRQMQVLHLVADGNTTPQIARRLRISVKTVETHRGELMKRLGIHDVVGIVRYAVRVGMVSPVPQVAD